MPRAPRTTRDNSSLAAYRAAWQAVMQLLREGHSFSGHERNCVFLNGRGSRFADVSAVTGLDFADDGRALAVTDWDGDGDLDVWLYNRTGPRLRLMRNQTIMPDSPAHAGFVSVRLEGTASNRDAIGARVELLTADQPSLSAVDSGRKLRMIQTLTAGDAFLSQSTKWLHFGLPADRDAATELVVQWPAGTTERFSGIRSGHRYRLVEGSGRAAELPEVQRRFAPKPGAQPTVKASVGQRVFLSNRLPLPMLRYQAAEQSIQSLVSADGRPLLVVLWASWCAPCIAELTELEDQYESLHNEGVDILALSVDGLDPTRTTDWTDAKAVSDRLQLSFPVGTASREMLDKLEVAEGVLFNRLPALSVPSSFLVDKDDEIAVIYRGRLELSRLLSDLNQLDATIAERREFAVPFSGRWTNAPRQLLVSAVARLFRQNGYEEDYVRYLEVDADHIQRLRERAGSDQQRAQIDRQYASAHFNLGLALSSAGDAENATDHFRRSVAAKPDHVEALTNLGAMLARKGRLQEAIPFLRKAVSLEADSVAARMNLAAALGSAGDFGGALEHYRHVLKTKPATKRVHARLARALLEQEQVVDAVEHLSKAVDEDATDFPSTLSLAWLRATHPDDSLRDGKQAIQLAGRLNSATRGRDPRVLDVLAASFAESGDFEQARRLAETALQRLGTGNSSLKSLLRSRLKQYEKDQAYRDPDGRYP